MTTKVNVTKTSNVVHNKGKCFKDSCFDGNKNSENITMTESSNTIHITSPDYTFYPYANNLMEDMSFIMDKQHL